VDQKARISALRDELMDKVPAVAAESIAAPPVEAPPTDARYFNRELSWLAFNRRVLEEASNPKHPLLERVRFLSISANNLDEFFMVRVAGLKAHQALGVDEMSPEGLTVAQQLAAITLEADRLVTSQHEVWGELQALLDQAGMHVIGDGEPLDVEAETWLDQQFREQIFPILTPQAIDPAHPFPFIPNKGLSLIFELRKGKASVRELIMAPSTLPRFVRIPGDTGRYIALETLIRRRTDYLFPKYEVLRGGAFRIIRDSDIEVEEEAEDLALYFRSAIKRRRRRVSFASSSSPACPKASSTRSRKGSTQPQRSRPKRAAFSA
jgi:polyphosphate kinase